MSIARQSAGFTLKITRDWCEGINKLNKTSLIKKTVDILATGSFTTVYRGDLQGKI